MMPQRDPRGSLPGITCGSCRRLRRWRMRSFGRQRCVDCPGPFATLVTSDCSHRDRVFAIDTQPFGAARHRTFGGIRHRPCGSCRRLRRWRMRTFSCRRCVDCTGLFATLVTSDCSHRDRVMRWIPPGTTPVGVARHKSCGSELAREEANTVDIHLSAVMSLREQAVLVK